MKQLSCLSFSEKQLHRTNSMVKDERVFFHSINGKKS